MRVTSKRSQKAGLPPGTPMYVGEKKVEKTTITVIDYDEAGVREQEVDTAEACRCYVATSSVTWINVVGLHETDVLQQFGDVFSIHPLVLEDISSMGRRPKTEDHGDCMYVVLKMLYRSKQTHDILAEQVSLLLGRGWVLSFQEVPGDVFDIIRERIRTAKGRIRKMKCDYLAYSLIDAIVDNYFAVLEEVGERIEDLQEQVLEQASPRTVEEMHLLKQDLIFMRKNLWPLREVLSALEKSESALIGKALRPYLRDVYEHTIHVIDTVETLRDMLNGALDIYLTTVSNRMNEVMRVLTVIATIFIPMTFLAGVYGMNFEHMPELKWPWAYPVVWGLMILVAVSMLAYFKRRKWL